MLKLNTRQDLNRRKEDNQHPLRIWLMSKWCKLSGTRTSVSSSLISKGCKRCYCKLLGHRSSLSKLFKNQQPIVRKLMSLLSLTSDWAKQYQWLRNATKHCKPRSIRTSWARELLSMLYRCSVNSVKCFIHLKYSWSTWKDARLTIEHQGPTFFKFHWL